MVEKKEVNDLAFEIQKLSDSEESDHEDNEINTPDMQLLAMQKQRSIPPVMICEFNEEDNEEKVHLEVDGDKMGDLADSPLLIGMMSAGGEEKMFRRYSQESPLLKAKGHRLGAPSNGENKSTGASIGSANSKE